MGIATGVVAATLAAPASAGGIDEIQQLRAELDALRADNTETRQELAELKSENGQNWLNEQRAGEIRGIVQDVLADAETRTSLQDSGATSGWNGKNFVLSSPDGNYTLRIKGQIQVRWTMNSAKDLPTLNGFENRRTKLYFEGNIVDPSWNYRVKMAFKNSSEAGLLEEAWIKKDLGSISDGLAGASIKAGAFKAPWMREELVSSSKQLTVDRSVVNEYFNQDYDKGIEFAYATDAWRFAGWYGNGINSPSVGYSDGDTSSWNTNPTRWSFAGRFEYRIGGSWKQFKDFSSFRGEDFGVLLGVSAMGQKFNNNATAPAGSPLQYGVTADATIDFGGASVFASFVWMNNRADIGGGVEKSTPWGATIQGGYFVTDDIEVFGRYAHLYYDDQLPSNQNRYNGLTMGLNWFLAGKAVKFTTDWSINLDSFGRGYSGIGWREDNTSADKNQWALRAQLQLLF